VTPHNSKSKPSKFLSTTIKQPLCSAAISLWTDTWIDTDHDTDRPSFKSLFSGALSARAFMHSPRRSASHSHRKISPRCLTLACCIASKHPLIPGMLLFNTSTVERAAQLLGSWVLPRQYLKNGCGSGRQAASRILAHQLGIVPFVVHARAY